MIPVGPGTVTMLPTNLAGPVAVGVQRTGELAEKTARAACQPGRLSGAALTSSGQEYLVRGEVTQFLQRRNGKRRYFSLVGNTTISLGNQMRHSKAEELGMPFVHNAESDPRRETPEGQALRERVIQHAQNRVCLFYLMAVAYKDEQVDIERDATCLQYGIGPCPGWSAAHSCILPSVKDSTFDQINKIVREKGLGPEQARRLLALGACPKKMEECRQTILAAGVASAEFDVRSLFLEPPDEQLISRRSSFYQAMNSTVILPAYMNGYDSEIEEVMRPFALDLLNKVSKEGMAPYEAVEAFVERLEQFFMEDQIALSAKIEALQSVFRAEQLMTMAELAIRNCDLSDSKESLAALEKYVRGMWHLQDNLSKVSSIQTGQSLGRLFKKRHARLKKGFSKVADYSALPCKSRKKLFLNELPADSMVVLKKVKALKKAISELAFWPQDLGPPQEALRKALAVSYLQEQGSVVLSMEYLSGIMEEGVLRPMNNQELEEQKFTIIRARMIKEYEEVDFLHSSIFKK